MRTNQQLSDILVKVAKKCQMRLPNRHSYQELKTQIYGW